MPQHPHQLPKVAIIGCGFAGLEAARALANAPVQITLIDRTNHHLFQPLLYEVATAGLSAPAISAPIRHILRRQIARGRLTVLQGQVQSIDAAARTLQLDGDERIGYDHLIVAAGTRTSYFGNEAWAQHAPGLKTLADALAIRARVIGAFERAERCNDPMERAAWMSFVVVGAGPTGVEMAGTLSEIARETLSREFRRIDSKLARVVLLEGSGSVLGSFEPGLQQRARAQLKRLGVDVRTHCRVTDIHVGGVSYQSQEGDVELDHHLPTRTVIWAAGVAGVSLGVSLAESAGATLDRSGRVLVLPDLSLVNHPEISVIGDLAAAYSHGDAGKPPTPVPGLSPAAKQMGRLAAANLLRRLRGEPTRAFRYHDAGSLATIGRSAAVADLALPLFGRCRLSGWPAWLLWLFAHIYFLIGYRNRLLVLLDWAGSYITYDRRARVVAAPPEDAQDTQPPVISQATDTLPLRRPN